MAKKAIPIEQPATWALYAQEIEQLHLPRYRELPDIELYMDQMITYVTERTRLFLLPGDKPLTSSMVNNYVKSRIIPQPENRRYTKLHVAYLIIVSILKRSYSMAEIEQLISIEVQHRFQAGAAYDKFVDLFEASLRMLFCGTEAPEKVGGLSVSSVMGSSGLRAEDPLGLTEIDRLYLVLATSAASRVYIDRSLAFRKQD